MKLTCTGARERFFLGDKNVDMPSDYQNLGGGGHRHIHPNEIKSWGPIPPRHNSLFRRGSIISSADNYGITALRHYGITALRHYGITAARYSLVLGHSANYIGDLSWCLIWRICTALYRDVNVLHATSPGRQRRVKQMGLSIGPRP